MASSSEFVKDLTAAVEGKLYRCVGCQSAYLIDRLEVRSGHMRVSAFNLTRDFRQTLTLDCVEDKLHWVSPRNLSSIEEENYRKYQTQRRREASGR